MKKLLFLAVAALVMAVAALPASAQYQPMFITVNPTAVQSCGTNTGNVTVNSGYWQSGTNVTITLNSDPVVLGTLTAHPSGTATGTFNLPANVQEGAHTVTATGIGRDSGVSETLTASITVMVPPGCVSSNTAVPTTTSSGSLPVTGSDNGVFVAIGAGLLVAGGLLVMATRKRNARA